ncbi:unnamed protein product [Blepharisma stoltei]|uniref:Uncharacterized protein n=1 Tax=Blepharisma stoltei TaxID=1481888 RepID=A0AAU9JL39_9CILI|nr:unnamed protein product [Blepharisma stoltei]
MEITRFNIHTASSLIKKAINNADFLAMDMEFGGINTRSYLLNTSLDSTEHRYLKLRENAKEFCPLQLGLTAFNISGASAESSTFSFYISPLEFSRNRHGFSINPGSINYLADYNFDFNKAFKEGLWIHKDSNFSKKNLTRKGKRILDKYKNFLLEGIENGVDIPVEFIDLEELEFIIKSIEKDFGVVGTLCVKDRIPYAVKFKKGQAENDDCGKLFLDIVNSMAGKPLIGHNMITDLLQFHDKLIAPLPMSVKNFALKLNSKFPTIIDTKYIIQSSSLLKHYFNITKKQGANLSECYKAIEKDSEFSNLKVTQPFNNEETNFHNAGFDSYITGALFIRILQILKITFTKNLSDLENIVNKIPMSGSGRLPLNLSKPTQFESFENIYVLKNPENIPIEKIKEVLSGNFESIAIYKIFWTEEFVYVVPSSLNALNRMKKIISKTTNLDIFGTKIEISPYEDFVELDKSHWLTE